MNTRRFLSVSPARRAGLLAAFAAALVAGGIGPIATRLGVTGEVLHAIAPRVAQIVMNSAFRMFPDSAASRGEKDKKYVPTAEAAALAQVMRGIHF